MRPDLAHGGEHVIALRFRDREPVGQAFGIAVPKLTATDFGGHGRDSL
jgi:hypothetical protein